MIRRAFFAPIPTDAPGDDRDPGNSCAPAASDPRSLSLLVMQLALIRGACAIGAAIFLGFAGKMFGLFRDCADWLTADVRGESYFEGSRGEMRISVADIDGRMTVDD